MLQILSLIIVIFLLVLMPLFLGNRLVKEGGIETQDVFLSYIFGWVKMFAWFQIIAIPFIFLRFSLTSLVIAWTSGIIALLAYYLIRNFRGYTEIASGKPNMVRPSYLEVLAVGLVLFQLFVVTFLAHEDADDWFFIGQASTDMHTNTLMGYDAGTGRVATRFHPRYVFAPFPTFLAVISRLVMMHPLTVARFVFQIIFIILCYMVYYLLAKEVFGKVRDKIAICLIFVSLLNLWGNVSAFTSSSFLLLRIHQGKALLANFILPLLIYLLVSYYREAKYNQRDLLLVMISSTLVSAMGVFLAPMLLGIYGVVRFARERKVLILGQVLLCSMPNIVVGIGFLLIR